MSKLYVFAIPLSAKRTADLFRYSVSDIRNVYTDGIIALPSDKRMVAPWITTFKD